MRRKRKTAAGYFEVSVTVGHGEHGERKRKRVRAKTQAGLIDKLQNVRAVLSDNPTVKEFLVAWLEDDVKSMKRATTYRRYEMDIRNHIIPALGYLRMRALADQDIQRLINKLHKAGRAPRTLRGIRAVLRKALNVAKRRKLVAENVAVGVELPAPEETEYVILTPEQVRTLLDAVHGERLEALYWTATLLGMRQGELLGLRWQDVDFASGTIHVRQQVQRVDGALTLVPVKTKAGRRELPIIPLLEGVLLRHRAMQQDESGLSTWQEHGLVFPSEVGTPMNPNNLYRHFKALLKRAGLADMRFHDLRHTAVSQWIVSGTDAKTASSLAGHTSVGFTLTTYAHSLATVRRLNKSAQLCCQLSALGLNVR